MAKEPKEPKEPKEQKSPSKFVYNSELPPIHIKEYGRIVEKIIQYITKLKDKEKRKRCVHEVIEIMRLFSPDIKDKEDHLHKLWDYLFIISDYKLDVESPFPKPKKDLLKLPPERVNYSNHDFSYRHYGKLVESLIKKAQSLEDDTPEKENLVFYIASLMKMYYLIWNKDNISDIVIADQLKELSNGHLIFKPNGKNLDILFDLNKISERKEERKKYKKDNFVYRSQRTNSQSNSTNTQSGNQRNNNYTNYNKKENNYSKNNYSSQRNQNSNSSQRTNNSSNTNRNPRDNNYPRNPNYKGRRNSPSRPPQSNRTDGEI